MKSVLIPALAGLAGLAMASGSAHASDTARSAKGLAPIPAKATRTASSAPRVCNPDPLKGKVCRHYAAKAQSETNRAETFAQAKTAAPGRSLR